MPEFRRRLRVAHATPTYLSTESVIGGGERYVYNLAQALAAAPRHPDIDFTQTILTLGKRDHDFDYGGIPVRVFVNENTSTNPMAGISGRFWQEFASFDLVHVHQSLAVFGAYSAIVAKSLGKTLVLTDLGGGDNSIMTTGRGLELGDGVVSISKFAHSLIASKFSGPHEVMSGPVDTDRFSPRNGDGADRNSAICVSRIMPHKGIDRIIRALPAQMRLRVVGPVDHQPYYEDLHRLAEGKNVEFIVDADDDRLVALYRSSGLFLQGSTAKDCYDNVVAKPELMGLAVLEAMACGLPAIVSDVASLPELVSDPRFGRVFANHDELAGLLDAFTSGTWPATDAAERARRHVIDNYSASIVGQRIGDFYASLPIRANAS